MAECQIRYRPSGGRGEYEFTPSTSLLDRHVIVKVPALGIEIPSAVWGRRRDGKPRLRKLNGNDRSVLHLPTLILTLAKLPEPAREDKGKLKVWPLEEKGYIADTITCDVVQDDGQNATLVPRRLAILHSEQEIDLENRYATIAAEFANLPSGDPALKAALEAFKVEIAKGVNSRDLRIAADKVIARQTDKFGPTNAASIAELAKLAGLPASDLEEGLEGKEGRLLTRWHSFRERDRNLVKNAKAAFKAKHGKLYCECCGVSAVEVYGDRGLDRIQAHHRIPVEQLVPGTVTKAEDLAMVCPNCHDIIHAKRPWVSVEAVQTLIEATKATTN